MILNIQNGLQKWLYLILKFGYKIFEKIWFGGISQHNGPNK